MQQKRALNAIFFILFLASCYWDNEETLYGTVADTCDLVQISYGLDVVPILDFNCNSCHAGSSAAALGDNIVLDDYNLLLNYVNNGRLIGSINHDAGFNAMPRSGSKLSACHIEVVQTWINNGAQND